MLITDLGAQVIKELGRMRRHSVGSLQGCGFFPPFYLSCTQTDRCLLILVGDWSYGPTVAVVRWCEQI